MSLHAKAFSCGTNDLVEILKDVIIRFHNKSCGIRVKENDQLFCKPVNKLFHELRTEHRLETVHQEELRWLKSL